MKKNISFNSVGMWNPKLKETTLGLRFGQDQDIPFQENKPNYGSMYPGNRPYGACSLWSKHD